MAAGGAAIKAVKVEASSVQWLLRPLSQLKLLCLKLVNEARSLRQLWSAERGTPVSTDQPLGSPEKKRQQVGLCSRHPNGSLCPNVTPPPSLKPRLFP